LTEVEIRRGGLDALVRATDDLGTRGIGEAREFV
jgi:hypothetical protein